MDDQRLTNPLVEDEKDDDNNNIFIPCYAKTKLRFCGFICCGIFILLLSIQFFFVPTLIKKIKRNKVVDALVFTEPDTSNDQWNQWVSNKGEGQMPLYFNVEFFNINNPDGVLNGEYPNITLTKTIVYNSVYERKNIQFTSNKYWVAYDFFIQFFYNPSISALKENNKNYTVFSPVLGACLSICHDKWGKKIPEKDKLSPKIVGEYIACNKTLHFLQTITNKKEAFDLLFLRGTPYELIWSFVPEKWLPILEYFDLNISQIGLMVNNSHQSYLTHTGKDDVSRMGEILKFYPGEIPMSGNITNTFLTVDPNNYNDYYNWTSIPHWIPEPPYNPSHLFYFGLYNLVDDSIHNPGYYEGALPTLYINILKRRVVTDFCGYYDVKGIKTMRYCLNISPQLDTCNSNISTPYYYPPNCQYNSYGPPGVLNMSAQYGNAPIYITLPYFINASYYEKQLTNMSLNMVEDSEYSHYITWFDVEPQTGAILAANATMQLASPMNPIPNTIFENLQQDVMVPMYMIGYSAEFPDGLANDFKKNMNIASGLYYFSVYSGYICLPLIIIFSWYVCYTIGYSREYNKEYKSSSSYNNKKSSIIN